jgi:hypothetical protein
LSCDATGREPHQKEFGGEGKVLHPCEPVPGGKPHRSDMDVESVLVEGVGARRRLDLKRLHQWLDNSAFLVIHER